MAPKTVIAWVHPRSTSTMLECVFLQRQDEFEVLHEPMGDAWYFGPEHVAPRYPQDQIDTKYPQYKEATFKKIWSNIAKKDGKRIFSKDMAQYILPAERKKKQSLPSSFDGSQDDPKNPTLIPAELLLDPEIVHTFLIRTPEKAIPSYHRLCFPGSETGFDFFDPNEAGYLELRQLFDYLHQKTGKLPLIIDSADLLDDPESIMRMYCEHVRVDFRPSMLEWDASTRTHFEKWPGFHTSAENSTGIGKTKEEHCTPGNHDDSGKVAQKGDSAPPTPSSKPKKEQPQVVKDCIAENMPHYEYLSQFTRKQ